MIENFANVEAEIYGGVPDVPLKITCSLNVDASFWLQMFSAKLMLHRISMKFLMMGNASTNSKYHWIPLLNFAHNLWCSILFLVVFFLVQYRMFTQLAFVEVAKTAVKRNKTWPEEAVFVFFSLQRRSHWTNAEKIALAPRRLYLFIEEAVRTRAGTEAPPVVRLHKSLLMVSLLAMTIHLMWKYLMHGSFLQ